MKPKNKNMKYGFRVPWGVPKNKIHGRGGGVAEHELRGGLLCSGGALCLGLIAYAALLCLL